MKRVPHAHDIGARAGTPTGPSGVDAASHDLRPTNGHQSRADLTVVFPMYREAERIERTAELLAASPLCDPAIELIFVDDGSDDDTVVRLNHALATHQLDASIIRLPANRGKGAAVRAGMLEASGDVVVYTDADLSTRPDEILRVAHAVSAGDCDVAIGSRALANSTIAVRQSALRQMSGRMFNRVVRAFGLTSFSDTQCGLKAFRSSVIDVCFSTLTTPGFAFDVEVLHRASIGGLRVLEVPVVWAHVEASRVSPVRDGLAMIRDVAKIRRRLAKSARREATPAPGLMQTANIDAMSRVEDEHWWFQAKRELVQAFVDPKSSSSILDVGCGTGVVVEALGASSARAFGVDLDTAALARAHQRQAGRLRLARSRAETLPFRTGAFGALVSLDVIEHLDDDVTGLVEYRRVLRPGGRLVVAVPAYQWAWSDHDVMLGHRRRYSRSQLNTALDAAGFERVRTTYFHSWLVPLAFVLRRTPLRKLMKGTAEEASFVSPAVNRALKFLTVIERALIGRFDLPFGLSILAVANVPSDSAAVVRDR